MFELLLWIIVGIYITIKISNFTSKMCPHNEIIIKNNEYAICKECKRMFKIVE